MPTFSPHARKRMEERKIAEDEVLRALNAQDRPTDVLVTTAGSLCLDMGRGSRILKMVLTADEQVIVSVMAQGE